MKKTLLLVPCILVILGHITDVQSQDNQECFTTEWAMGMIPCFVQPILDTLQPLLDMLPEGTLPPGLGSASGRRLLSLNEGHSASRDRPAHMNKWFKLLNGLKEVHNEYEAILVDTLKGEGMYPHTEEQKYRFEIIKKLLKIDRNQIYHTYFENLLELQDEGLEKLQVMFETIPEFKQARTRQTGKSNPETYDTLRDLIVLACGLPGGSDFTDVCDAVKSAYDCLLSYNETDFEDNLRWVQCLYKCQDLPFISTCVRDQFENCSLPLFLGLEADLSWLGDFIIRVFVDYLQKDECLVPNILEPNDTSTGFTLEEGGPEQNIKFQMFLPPQAYVVNLAGLNTPLGMIRLLGEWITGRVNEWDVKVLISNHNWVNSLYAKRLNPSDLDLEIPGVPIIPNINFFFGRPACQNNSMIKQTVIGWHDDADTSSGSGQIHITNDNWYNRTFSVPIKAVIDGKQDSNQDVSITMKFMTGIVLKHSVKIPVTVVDKDVGSVMTCSVVNDPHTITFDQFYYNNYYEGYFWLYRHDEYPYSVQAIYQKCEPNGAVSCTCAVAVRSGDDVLVLDNCRRVEGEEWSMRAILYVNGELTPGTRIFKQHGGIKYQVILPHGTVVKALLHKDNWNIFIHPSAADWSRSNGLCGVPDNDQTNDLTFPNGTSLPLPPVQSQPREFNQAWRVSDDDNIFWGVEEGDGLDQLDLTQWCNCVHRNLLGLGCTCSYSELVEDCDLNTEGEIEEHALISVGSLRQKAVDDGVEILDDIDIDLDFEPGDFGSANRTTSNWCRDQLREGDAMTQSCFGTGIGGYPPLPGGLFNPYRRERYICENDVVITGTEDWIIGAIEAGKERCRSQITKRVQYSKKYVDELEASSCINSCNKQGSCDINGTCICDDQYAGDDCSIIGGIDPKLIMEPSVVCDIRKENCTYIKLYGENMLEAYDIKCEMTEESAIDESDPGPAASVDAIYISPFQIACMPPTSTTSYRVKLSHSSTSQLAPVVTEVFQIRYDSACYECDISKDPPSCKRKEDSDHCFIGGRCYAPYEVKPDDECFHCDTRHSTTDWSLIDTQQCGWDFNQTINAQSEEKRADKLRIITASVLSATVAITALILFLTVGRMSRETNKLKKQLLKAEEGSEVSSGGGTDDKPSTSNEDSGIENVYNEINSDNNGATYHTYDNAEPSTSYAVEDTTKF